MTDTPQSLTWWYDKAERVWTGQDLAGVTVARIRWAKEGEAEGGLGLLVRHMRANLNPNVAPEGWYWSATIEQRGVWTSWKRIQDVEKAKFSISDQFFQNRSKRLLPEF
jgi:hypothetical protein